MLNSAGSGLLGSLLTIASLADLFRPEWNCEHLLYNASQIMNLLCLHGQDRNLVALLQRKSGAVPRLGVMKRGHCKNKKM